MAIQNILAKRARFLRNMVVISHELELCHVSGLRVWRGQDVSEHIGPYYNRNYNNDLFCN
jgi:hypothetical protein